jgi:hypothetical protein
MQNLLPALVMDTYPNDQITMDRIKALIERIPPTPPINGGT